MVASVQAVNKMARENGCGEGKKSDWTQSHIRDMIGAIIKFMKRLIDRSDRFR